MKTVVNSADAPAAVGPYSQAVKSGNLLFISGQTSADPASGKPVSGGPAAEVAQCLKNLEAILKAAGLGMDAVFKTTVFLTDMAHFAAVNEVYAKAFVPPYPARACVAVKALPLGCLVEMEAIAAFS